MATLAQPDPRSFRCVRMPPVLSVSTAVTFYVLSAQVYCDATVVLTVTLNQAWTRYNADCPAVAGKSGSSPDITDSLSNR